MLGIEIPVYFKFLISVVEGMSRVVVVCITDVVATSLTSRALVVTPTDICCLFSIIFNNRDIILNDGADCCERRAIGLRERS